MKRLELFEFEDFSWFPEIIRTSMTNLIVVFHKMMGTSTVLSNLILDLQKKHFFNQITDLGSGSGGSMLDVIQQINKNQKGEEVKLVLTDLHPNPQMIEKINNLKLKNVTYHDQPINAINIDKTPKGLKTMIASFHHMNPTIAKKILHTAQANREPILIFELAKNNIPTLLWWLFLPISLIILILMSAVMTLFVRPLTFQQILFTYFIPIIPLAYAWDGQASLMRTYTFDDVKNLIGEINDDYHWEIDDAKKANGKKLGYYILGYPK